MVKQSDEPKKCNKDALICPEHTTLWSKSYTFVQRPKI
mgnify:CR=1 FL=1